MIDNTAHTSEDADGTPEVGGDHMSAETQENPVATAAPRVAAVPQVGQVPALGSELLAQYERLASRVLFAEADDRFMLAVTSALAGEGVTTACVSTGVALAESTNKSVLIVDANLRKPALHDMFQVAQQPGLREMIPYADKLGEWLDSGRVHLQKLGITPTVVPNLFVHPSGAAHDTPTQLMTSDAAGECLDFLRSRFSYVILDCPPLLTAVDAGSLCRLANGTAIVIRAGLTLRDDVRRAQERLQGASVMGVVLNGA
jgi:capsular exopolysaccharide synthesis family protein